MNLVEPLLKWASSQPEKTALIEGSGTTERSISYRELHHMVETCALQLQAQHFDTTTRALVMQPVGIDLYILLLACFSLGSTVVVIDPAVDKKAIQHALSVAPPNAYIGCAKAHFLRLKHPAIRKIEKHFHTSHWVPASKKIKLSTSNKNRFPKDFIKELSPEHPALITFTSGSTGAAKAACRTHGFLINQHQALSSSLNDHPNDIDLVTLPVFGLSNLASGMTSIIADTDLKFPAQADSSKILQQCLTHQVSRCSASPAFFKKLHNDGNFPPFARIHTGGAPVFPSFLQKLANAHQKLEIVTVYGSTEAEPISHQYFRLCDTSQLKAMQSGKGLLVGKPVKEISIHIIPLEDKSSAIHDIDLHALPPENIGEIIVSGKHVLDGYINNELNYQSKIKSSDKIWHRTGDAGYIDTNGSLWLMGRCSAIIINPNQSNIYPFAVETAAMSVSTLEACAVIQQRSKTILCYQGVLHHEQLKLMKEKTAPLGVNAWKQLPHIPMDTRHNAKVDYPALEALL